MTRTYILTAAVASLFLLIACGGGGVGGLNGYIEPQENAGGGAGDGSGDGSGANLGDGSGANIGNDAGDAGVTPVVSTPNPNAFTFSAEGDVSGNSGATGDSGLVNLLNTETADPALDSDYALCIEYPQFASNYCAQPITKYCGSPALAIAANLFNPICNLNDDYDAARLAHCKTLTSAQPDGLCDGFTELTEACTLAMTPFAAGCASLSGHAEIVRPVCVGFVAGQDDERIYTYEGTTYNATVEQCDIALLSYCDENQPNSINRLFSSDCEQISDLDEIIKIDARRGAACIAGNQHGFCTEFENRATITYCNGQAVTNGITHTHNLNPIGQGCKNVNGQSDFDYQVRAGVYCNALITGDTTPFSDDFNNAGCRGTASFGQIRAEWCGDSNNTNDDCPAPLVTSNTVSADFQNWATELGTTNKAPHDPLRWERFVVETDLDGKPKAVGVEKRILSPTRDTANDSYANIIQGPANVAAVDDYNLDTDGTLTTPNVPSDNTKRRVSLTLEEVRLGEDNRNDGFFLAEARLRNAGGFPYLYAGLLSGIDVGDALTEPSRTANWDASLRLFAREFTRVASERHDFNLAVVYEGKRTTFTLGKTRINEDVTNTNAGVRRWLSIAGVVTGKESGGKLLTGSVGYTVQRYDVGGSALDPQEETGVLTGLVGADGLVGVFAGSGAPDEGNFDPANDVNVFVGGIVARPEPVSMPCTVNPLDPALRMDPKDPNSPSPCTDDHVREYCSTPERLALTLTGDGTCRGWMALEANRDSCLAKPFDLLDVGCKVLASRSAPLLARIRQAQAQACADANDGAGSSDPICAGAANWCRARPDTTGCTETFVSNFCPPGTESNSVACAGSAYAKWVGQDVASSVRPKEVGSASYNDGVLNFIQTNRNATQLDLGDLATVREATQGHVTLNQVDGHDRHTGTGFALAQADFVNPSNPGLSRDRFYAGMLYGSDVGAPVAHKEKVRWAGRMQILHEGENRAGLLSPVRKFVLDIDFKNENSGISADPVFLFTDHEGKNQWLIISSTSFDRRTGRITNTSMRLSQYEPGAVPVNHNDARTEPTRLKTTQANRFRGVFGTGGAISVFGGIASTGMGNTNNNGDFVGGFVAGADICDPNVNLFGSICDGADKEEMSERNEARKNLKGYDRWKQAAVGARIFTQKVGREPAEDIFAEQPVGFLAIEPTPPRGNPPFGANYVEVGEEGLTGGGVRLLATNPQNIAVGVLTFEGNNSIKGLPDGNDGEIEINRRLLNPGGSGVSFARGQFNTSDGFTYAGLLSETSDLGGAIDPTNNMDTAGSTTGTWTGGWGLVSIDNDVYGGERGLFRLTVDYAAKTIKTIDETIDEGKFRARFPFDPDESENTPGMRWGDLTLNAKYNDIGIIYGESSVTNTRPAFQTRRNKDTGKDETVLVQEAQTTAYGSVTGLIGNWGAVGVFVSDRPGAADADFGTGYAGGFVVRPDVNVIELDCDPVGYPFEPSCDDEEDIATPRGRICADNPDAPAANGTCDMYITDYCRGTDPYGGRGCDMLGAQVIAAFRFNWCANPDNHHEDCPSTGSDDFNLWAVSKTGEGNTEQAEDRTLSQTLTRTRRVVDRSEPGNPVASIETLEDVVTKTILDPARDSDNVVFDGSTNFVRGAATALDLNTRPLEGGTALTLALDYFDGNDDAASGFAYAQAAQATDGSTQNKNLYVGLLSGTDVGAPLTGTADTSAVWRASLRLLTRAGAGAVAQHSQSNSDFDLKVTFSGTGATFVAKDILVFDGSAGDRIARNYISIDGSITNVVETRIIPGVDGADDTTEQFAGEGQHLLSGTVSYQTWDYIKEADATQTAGILTQGILTGLVGSDGLVGVFAGDSHSGNNDFVGGLVARYDADANVVQPTGYALWRGQPDAETPVAGAAAQADVDANGVVSLSTRPLNVQDYIVGTDNSGGSDGPQPTNQTYLLNGTNITERNIRERRIRHYPELPPDISTDELVERPVNAFNNRIDDNNSYAEQTFDIVGHRGGGVTFAYGFGSGGRRIGYTGLHRDTDGLGGVIPQSRAVANWRGQIGLANGTGLVSSNDLRLKVDYFNRTIKTTAITTLTGTTLASFKSPTWADVSVNAAYDKRGLVFGRTTIHGNNSGIDLNRVADLTGIIGRRGLAAAFNVRSGVNTLVGGLVANPPGPAAEAVQEDWPSYADWVGGRPANLPSADGAANFAVTARTLKEENNNNRIVGFDGGSRSNRIERLLRFNQLDLVDTGDYVDDSLSGISLSTTVIRHLNHRRYFAAGLTQDANVGAPIFDRSLPTARWDARLAVFYGNVDPERDEISRFLDSELAGSGIFNTDFNFCVDFRAQQFFFKSNAQDHCEGSDNNNITVSGETSPYVRLDGIGAWDSAGEISGRIEVSYAGTTGTATNAGNLSGIIGQNGALGVFAGGNLRDYFAGGFAARNTEFFVPSPAPRADFAAWQDSFAGTGLLGQYAVLTAPAEGTHFIAGSGRVARANSDATEDTEYLLLDVDNARAVRLNDLKDINDATGAFAYGSVGDTETRYYTGLLSTTDVGDFYTSADAGKETAYWRGRVAVAAGTGSIDPSRGDFWLEVNFATSKIKSHNAPDGSGSDTLSIMSAGYVQTLHFNGGWNVSKNNGVISGEASFTGTGTDGNAVAASAGTFNGLLGTGGAVGVFKSDTGVANPYVGGFVAHEGAGAPPICDEPAGDEAFTNAECENHELYRNARVARCTTVITAWDAHCEDNRPEYIDPRAGNNTNRKEAARDTACLTYGTDDAVGKGGHARCAVRSTIRGTCNKQSSVSAVSTVEGMSTAGCNQLTEFTEACARAPFTDGCLYLATAMTLQVDYCTDNIAGISDPLDPACTDGTYTHGGDVARAQLVQCQTRQSNDSRCDGLEPFTMACEMNPFGDGCLHLSNYAALEDSYCANTDDAANCAPFALTGEAWADNIRDSGNTLSIDVEPTALAGIVAPTAKNAFVRGLTATSGTLNKAEANGGAGLTNAIVEYLPFGVLDETPGSTDDGVGFIRSGTGELGVEGADDAPTDFYAGILTGTDLGSPVVANAGGSATWQGKLAIIIGAGTTDQSDFTLQVDYSAARTITASAVLKNDRTFDIAAKYTAKGIIFGEATLTQTIADADDKTSTGSISGLIGSANDSHAQNRAVGAFISDGETTDAGRFAGGFVATPQADSHFHSWTTYVREGLRIARQISGGGVDKTILATATDGDQPTNIIHGDASGLAGLNATALILDRVVVNGRIGVGNSADGFAIARAENSYVGLLSGTNVGAALFPAGMNANRPQNAQWDYSLRILTLDDGTSAVDLVADRLNVSFEASRTTFVSDAKALPGYVIDEQTTRAKTISINGAVANGSRILTGSASYKTKDGEAAEETYNGVLSGLVGSDGLVGVFASGDAVGATEGHFIGGIVARPAPAAANFAAWRQTFNPAGVNHGDGFRADLQGNNPNDILAYFVPSPTTGTPEGFGLINNNHEPISQTFAGGTDSTTGAIVYGYTYDVRSEVGALLQTRFFTGLAADSDVGPVIRRAVSANWSGEIGFFGGTRGTQTGEKPSVFVEPTVDTDLFKVLFGGTRNTFTLINDMGSTYRTIGGHQLRLSGSWDSGSAVLSGTATLNPSTTNTGDIMGVLNGIIGDDGALGVFKSVDAEAARGYAGGFTAVAEACTTPRVDPFNLRCKDNDAYKAERIKFCRAPTTAWDDNCDEDSHNDGEEFTTAMTEGRNAACLDFGTNEPAGGNTACRTHDSVVMDCGLDPFQLTTDLSENIPLCDDVDGIETARDDACLLHGTDRDASRNAIGHPDCPMRTGVMAACARNPYLVPDNAASAAISTDLCVMLPNLITVRANYCDTQTRNHAGCVGDGKTAVDYARTAEYWGDDRVLTSFDDVNDNNIIDAGEAVTYARTIYIGEITPPSATEQTGYVRGLAVADGVLNTGDTNYGDGLGEDTDILAGTASFGALDETPSVTTQGVGFFLARTRTNPINEPEPVWDADFYAGLLDGTELRGTLSRPDDYQANPTAEWKAALSLIIGEDAAAAITLSDFTLNINYVNQTLMASDLDLENGLGFAIAAEYTNNGVVYGAVTLTHTGDHDDDIDTADTTLTSTGNVSGLIGSANRRFAQNRAVGVFISDITAGAGRFAGGFVATPNATTQYADWSTHIRGGQRTNRQLSDGVLTKTITAGRLNLTWTGVTSGADDARTLNDLRGTDNGDDGFRVVSNENSYVELFSGTDLGQPISGTKDADKTLTWRGQLRLATRDNVRGVIDAADFVLTVGFGSGQTTFKTVDPDGVGPKDDFVQLNTGSSNTSKFIRIDGAVANGAHLLTGTVDYKATRDNPATGQGILTGLAGLDGVVGVFVGEGEDEGVMGDRSDFIGGFVARPQTRGFDAWQKFNSFPPTVPTITGGGFPQSQFLSGTRDGLNTGTTGVTVNSLNLATATYEGRAFGDDAQGGDAADGVAWFTRDGHHYAGLFSGTDLGAPVTDTRTSGTEFWNGRIMSLVVNDFRLRVDFTATGGTIEAFVSYEAAEATLRTFLRGRFDANGVITDLAGNDNDDDNLNTTLSLYGIFANSDRTSAVLEGDKQRNKGRLTGLIGEEGAIGAFYFIGAAGAESPSGFAGGFVASRNALGNTLANGADWQRSLGADVFVMGAPQERGSPENQYLSPFEFKSTKNSEGKIAITQGHPVLELGPEAFGREIRAGYENFDGTNYFYVLGLDHSASGGQQFGAYKPVDDNGKTVIPTIEYEGKFFAYRGTDVGEVTTIGGSDGGKDFQLLINLQDRTISAFVQESEKRYFLLEGTYNREGAITGTANVGFFNNDVHSHTQKPTPSDRIGGTGARPPNGILTGLIGQGGAVGVFISSDITKDTDGNIRTGNLVGGTGNIHSSLIPETGASGVNAYGFAGSFVARPAHKSGSYALWKESLNEVGGRNHGQIGASPSFSLNWTVPTARTNVAILDLNDLSGVSGETGIVGHRTYDSSSSDSTHAAIVRDEAAVGVVLPSAGATAYWPGRVAVLATEGSDPTRPVTSTTRGIDVPDIENFWLRVEFASNTIASAIGWTRATDTADISAIMNINSKGGVQKLRFNAAWDTTTGVIYNGSVDFTGAGGPKQTGVLTGLIGVDGALGVFRGPEGAENSFVGSFVAHPFGAPTVVENAAAGSLGAWQNAFATGGAAETIYRNRDTEGNLGFERDWHAQEGTENSFILSLNDLNGIGGASGAVGYRAPILRIERDENTMKDRVLEVIYPTYRAGLLDAADVGAAFTNTALPTAYWRGRLGVAAKWADNVANPDMVDRITANSIALPDTESFWLEVDFANRRVASSNAGTAATKTSETIGVISILSPEPGQFRVQEISFSGTWDDNGVIGDGVVNYNAQFIAAQEGYFTGLIGAGGALGAFISKDDSNNPFAGGFVAHPDSVAPISSANADFDAWLGTSGFQTVSRDYGTFQDDGDWSLGDDAASNSTHYISGIRYIPATDVRVAMGTQGATNVYTLDLNSLGVADAREVGVVKFGTADNNRFYVGLVTGADLGLVPLDRLRASATWHGRLSFYGAGVIENAPIALNMNFADRSFNLPGHAADDINVAGFARSFASKKGDVNTVEGIRIRGQWDDKGLIVEESSTITVVQHPKNGDDRQTGVVTGLIGVDSLVLAFKSFSLRMRAEDQYVGGVIAHSRAARFVPPPPADGSFAAWSASLQSGGANADIIGTGSSAFEDFALSSTLFRLADLHLNSLDPALDDMDNEIAFKLPGGAIYGLTGDRYYASVGRDTALGAVTQTAGVAYWRGRVAVNAHLGGINTPSNDNIWLAVDFGQSRIAGVDAGSDADSPTEVLSLRRKPSESYLQELSFSGTWDTNGVIRGVASFTGMNVDSNRVRMTAMAEAGVLTGLVGADGAAGVFRSSDTQAANPFVGGFVARPNGRAAATPSDVNVAAWVASFDANGFNNRPTEPGRHPGTLLDTDGDIRDLASSHSRYIQATELGAQNAANTFSLDLGSLAGETGATGINLVKVGRYPERYYVGLVGDTTGAGVGVSFTDNIRARVAIWNGRASLYEYNEYHPTGDIITSTTTDAPVRVHIDFGVKEVEILNDDGLSVGESSVHSVANFGSNDRIGTVSTLRFKADWDAQGVLNGRSWLIPDRLFRPVGNSHSTQLSGTFTGLIGTGGLLGAFRSHDDTIGAGRYAGAVVAHPDATAPDTPPSVDEVTYADWLGGEGFTVDPRPRHTDSSNKFAPSRHGRKAELFGQPASGGSSLNLQGNRQLGAVAPAPSGSENNGIAYYRAGNENHAYAGIFSTANLGAPLSDNSLNGFWLAKFGMRRFGDDIDAENIRLAVRFNNGSNFGSISATSEPGVIDSNNPQTRLSINGNFGADGIITGTTALGVIPAEDAVDNRVTGVLSGLIGVKGALGVFVSAGTITTANSHVGGFVASAPAARAMPPADFAKWVNSFTIENGANNVAITESNGPGKLQAEGWGIASTTPPETAAADGKSYYIRGTTDETDLQGAAKTLVLDMDDLYGVSGGASRVKIGVNAANNRFFSGLVAGADVGGGFLNIANDKTNDIIWHGRVSLYGAIGAFTQTITNQPIRFQLNFGTREIVTLNKDDALGHASVNSMTDLGDDGLVDTTDRVRVVGEWNDNGVINGRSWVTSDPTRQNSSAIIGTVVGLIGENGAIGAIRNHDNAEPSGNLFAGGFVAHPHAAVPTPEAGSFDAWVASFDPRGSNAEYILHREDGFGFETVQLPTEDGPRTGYFVRGTADGLSFTHTNGNDVKFDSTTDIAKTSATVLSLNQIHSGSAATNGVAFWGGDVFIKSEARKRYYTGLLSGVDVGAPFTDANRAATVWNGRLSFRGGGSTAINVPIKVKFNFATRKFISDGHEQGNVNRPGTNISFNSVADLGEGINNGKIVSTRGRLQFNADWDDNGVIYPNPNTGAIFLVQGSETGLTGSGSGALTGVIGQDGLVVAFRNHDSVTNLKRQFAGGFVAHPYASAGQIFDDRVEYTDWLTSVAGAVPNAEASSFLHATSVGLVGQPSTDVMADSLNLMADGFGDVPNASGDEKDGIAYYHAMGTAFGYAGVLKGTSLGAPLSTVISNATWNGRMRMVRGGTHLDAVDISLSVGFDGDDAGTITAYPSVGAAGDMRRLRIDGRFNAQGVITGSSAVGLITGDPATTFSADNNGNLSGLIGASGAVGVFIGDGNQMDTDGYVGGFVACPSGGC